MGSRGGKHGGLTTTSISDAVGMRDAAAGYRCVYAASLLALAAVCSLMLEAKARPHAAATSVHSMLWGGLGRVTTGDYVDGRPTTPGLHTDCVPGETDSDCSPAQEDGAWSSQAAAYIDSHTAGTHSRTMQRLQADVDRAFKAKDDYTKACLADWRNCDKPAAEVTGYVDSIDDDDDAATFGIHQRFSAKPSLKYSGVAPPDQYAEYSPMMDDGDWNAVKRPSGHRADRSGLVSSAYWTSRAPPGFNF